MVLSVELTNYVYEMYYILQSTVPKSYSKYYKARVGLFDIRCVFSWLESPPLPYSVVMFDQRMTTPKPHLRDIL